MAKAKVKPTKKKSVSQGKLKSPLEMLKIGIINNDLSLLKEAYFLLTGERVGSKVGKKSKVVPQEDQEREYELGEIAARTNDHVNLFVDDGTQAVEDKEFDKKYPLPVSNRRKLVLVGVTCRLCNKQERVPNYLAPVKIEGHMPSYVCDDCGANR